MTYCVIAGFRRISGMRFLPLFFLVASLFFGPLLRAQDFPGIRTGNYTGASGVFYNPANIADSRYRWDLNLFAFHLGVGNNNASFSLKDMGHTFNGDSLRNKLTGAGAGLTNGALNLDIFGPALMIRLNKKSSFALSSRVRVMVNMKNIDGTLVNQFLSTNADNATFPYHFSTASDNIINVNAWTEFGASYGRVLVDAGPNFFKGGITLKYLAGFANGYMQLDNVQGTLNQDVGGVYLGQTTGLVGLGFGGTRIDDINSGKFGAFNGSGLGADIGFVYELRSRPHQYKLKVGIALLDIGSISYNKDTARSGAYTANITGAQKVYVDNFPQLDDYKQFFNSNPQFFTPAASNAKGSYSVSLPTTLQLDIDYHFIAGLYLNLAGQISMVSAGADKPYNSSYYNAFTITPRFESRHFGVYVPLNFSQLSQFNAGVGIRMGPFFLGSGSILTAALKNSKQLDLFMGLHIGGGK